MRTISTLIVAAAMAASLPAQHPPADFSKWWPQFQAAVAKKDAKAVAEMTHIPTQWELGKIRRLDSTAILIEKFDTYFPEHMRKAIAAKKPEKFSDGSYSITWQDHGDEYSLYFYEDGKGGYRLDGLSEGPA
jgi:hypothetical protein